MNRFNEVIYTDDDADDGQLFKDALKDTCKDKRFRFFEVPNDLFKFLTHYNTSLNFILFIDLNMPLKNGVQCVKEIRTQKRFQDVPVVVYSTSSDQHDIENSFNAGANLYVKKPNTYTEIKEMLLRIFSLDWAKYSPKPSRTKFFLKY